MTKLETLISSIIRKSPRKVNKQKVLWAVWKAQGCVVVRDGRPTIDETTFLFKAVKPETVFKKYRNVMARNRYYSTLKTKTKYFNDQERMEI